MEDKSISRGAIIIALSVLLSRILGIFREILLAGFAGLNIEKNAYDLAFLIPDIINHLVSTGYLSITFIPIFTGFLVKGNKEKAWEFFSNVLTCFTLVVVILLSLCWIFTEPLITALTRPTPPPETLKLAVHFSRIVIPAQLCFFIGTILIAVQYIERRFFLPSMMGVIYNSSIIICGWLGRSHGLEGFAWGVLLGAVVGSLGLQILGGIRAGAKFRFQLNIFDSFLHKYLMLTLPLILGLGAVFVLEYVYRAFGSAFGKQGIAALGYAYRMMYTLVAVFGFSVGVASYPVLARLAKEKAANTINEILYNTIIKILIILSPAIIFFWFCAEPVTRLLFQRGAFTAGATIQVALLLKWYLWSAFALSSQVILLRCFYAMEKMWLPTVINTGIFLLTLPLYKFLAVQLGIVGIPAAGAIGVTLQVSVLLFFWIKLTGTYGIRRFFIDGVKTGIAFVVGFLIIYIFKGQICLLMPSSLWKLMVFLCLFFIAVFSLQITLQIVFRISSAPSLWKGLASRFLRIKGH